MLLLVEGVWWWFFFAVVPRCWDPCWCACFVVLDFVLVDLLVVGFVR